MKTQTWTELGSESSPRRERPEQGGVRILVVDDEKEIREILSRVLSFMGYEADVASSGHEGLDLFLKHPFDLVVTDLNMPGIDGWTLAHCIKEHSPQTPVILITGETRAHVLNRIPKSCVDCALFKPFKLKDIEQTVRSILGKRRSKREKPFPAGSSAATWTCMDSVRRYPER